MRKIIYSQYDKSLIPALPVAAYDGRIVVIISPGETRKAVDFLLRQPILGIDTETKPSFKKGGMRPVALLQVAAPKICFLFRLNYTGMTDDIIRLLEDKQVMKVGLSLHDDVTALQRRVPQLQPGAFVDLQDHMKELGIEDLSLQKLYANLFGKKISKNQRLTNWEADILSDKQKTYAAIDAWACIDLYREYLRLIQTHDYQLVNI